MHSKPGYIHCFAVLIDQSKASIGNRCTCNQLTIYYAFTDILCSKWDRYSRLRTDFKEEILELCLIPAINLLFTTPSLIFCVQSGIGIRDSELISKKKSCV